MRKQTHVLSFLLLTLCSTHVVLAEVPEELRNYPYCELLPNTVADGEMTEYVFNTLGFNRCPNYLFDRITESDVISAYNKQYGANAISATVNGRRFWVLDNLVSNGGVSDSTYTLTVKGLKLGLRAQIITPVGSPTIGTDPYVVNTVQRNTMYTFKKGRYVYQLTDPCGNVYVMQSYTQQFEPTLTIEKLSSNAMSALLELPEGWNYSYQRLNTTLQLTAAGETHIVNDLLRNTYQINPAASTNDPSCW